ncbi:hypothetical protein EVAR_93444_1 [Eumeta japonica]|uniref:Uncharacterized protein n=1 Tax=Eumeta variegata TaxID=151549 RepID=A0A4C1TKC5_EUMVA|nr:hypothetical protein EVAR_93444_1 [Eumeta japonica]
MCLTHRPPPPDLNDFYGATLAGYNCNRESRRKLTRNESKRPKPNSKEFKACPRAEAEDKSHFTLAGSGRRTYCCLLRRLLVGDTTPTDLDGSGPFAGVCFVGSISHSVALLFRGRRLEEFSREGSAVRRLLMHRCDIPEEFMGVLVGDIIHPVSDVLDEFL